MRLKVNGVSIRVVDRIEIEIDVARDGEDLINGMQIRCRGGNLTVRQGSAVDAAFHFDTDRTMFFQGKDAGAHLKTHDPTGRILVTDTGINKIACREPGEDAIHILAEDG